MGDMMVWDKVGERYYENGVSKGALFVMTDDGYGAGVPWSGLTGVEENPDGAEANDLYADNVKYGTLRSAENFKATIKAYTYPDEFAACDGSGSPVKGLYLTQQNRKPFGMAYETNVGSDADPDEGVKLHLIYNATAAPSSKTYDTVNDSPEAVELSWEIETVPVAVADVDGVHYKPTSHIIIDSTKVGKEKFKAIEDIIYSGTFMTPDEVIAELKKSA